MLTKKTAMAFSAGVLTALAFAIAVGATRPAEPVIGRFQMSSSGAFAWVIDTATGQVWANSDRDTVQQFDKVKVPSTRP